MRAYYFDNIPGDQRLPHDSGRDASIATLENLGIKYWTIPVDGNEKEKIDAVATERGYKNRDVINVTRAGLGDAYDSKLKSFFEEHLHEDEEIRYILSGSGFFDVRDASTDEWIRIAIQTDDLLVLPAGIYHRFTLDTNDALSAMRLFKEDPKWTPINRSQDTDVNPHRIEYLKSIGATA